jgi:hypothetical protein
MGKNLRNRDAYDRSHMDWTFINGHLPRGIKVGDGDGIVEINWWLLLLERKLLSAGLGIDRAHRLMYQRMAMRGDTIIVFWADPPENCIEAIWIWSGHEGATDKPLKLKGPLDKSDLVFHAVEWSERAEAADRPHLVWPPNGVP